MQKLKINYERNRRAVLFIFKKALVFAEAVLNNKVRIVAHIII